MKKTFTFLAAVFIACVSAIGEKVHAALAGHMHNSGLILSAMPSAAEMARYRVTDPNQSEGLRQRLYDHLLYPLGGIQSLNFFNQQIGTGQSTAVGATVGLTKSIADTNMDVASVLPSGKEYLIETIEVYFYPGSSATANLFVPAYLATTATSALSATNVNQALDVQAFYESGVLDFRVLDKSFLIETPLRSFPPKTWLDADMTLAAADTTATTSVKLSAMHVKPDGRPYIMDPQISLQPATNFKVSLSWPTILALPSAFNARVGVYFDGYMMRAAQ